MRGHLVKPRDLDKAGSWLWNQVAAGCKSAGAVKPDMPLLLGMCHWWSTYARCMAKILKDDAETLATREGRGLMKAADDAWRNFERAASRFGLSPVDRARLRIPGEAEGNKADNKFFAESGG